MKKLFPLSLLLLLLIPSLVPAQTNGAEQIKITSDHLGLGTTNRGDLVIKHKSGGYYAGSSKVKEQLILELMKALDEPVVSKPELANLGITQEWLDANAEKGVKEYAEDYFSTAALNQQALYLSSFKNPGFIENVVPWLFNFDRSDDYPYLEVTITDKDGKQTTVASDSQYLFMIPWKITREGKTVETYNTHLSYAVANLLPKKFTNGARLTGERLRSDLAEAVMRRIKRDWDSLDAENKAGKYLESLRSKFIIEDVDINPYHNVDYGKEWVKGNPSDINLHATLRRGDFPENFFVSIVLPFKDGRVENVDLFLNTIERYRSLAMSVSWLTEYLKANPKVSIELRFVTDRSFSEKAMRIFADDMKGVGKEALATEVAAVQKDVSLIAVGRDYYQAHWLILPDGRMILWRYRGADALLKWKPDDFTHKDCKDYQGQCVGAVISPDGMLVPK